MAMEIQMPKYVDSLAQVLWWEADEFILGATIIGVGIMMHTVVYPVLAVLFLLPLMSRIKSGALEGAFMHILYSSGLIPLNKEFDNALETEFYQ